MFGESGRCRPPGELDAIGIYLLRRSALTLDHHLLDLRYGFAGIQTLGAGARAIEDRMAAIETEGVFELVETFLRRFISAVGQPAPGLEQNGRSQEAIAVPPMAWASGGAAEA